MRLYSLTSAAAVDDGEYGHFDPADDGGFDFPGPLSDRLHNVGVAGQRQWEDAVERQHRMIAEEQARRADPRTLLDAVEQLVKAAHGTSHPPAEPEAKPSRARGKTAAAKAG